jgi:hypothetical protein
LGPYTGSNSLTLELRDITLTGLPGNSVPVVQVNDRGALAMKAGSRITGNTVSNSGGAVYVRGTFATFNLSGGAVRDNILSGANSFDREVLVSDSGTFKLSGDAMPQRVFLYDNSRFITISGPLSGGPIPIDLGITGSAPLTGYKNIQMLKLDGAYTGNMAELKTHFSLGHTAPTSYPYSGGTPIEGYEIDNNGYFVEVTPAP